jgi:hypothetical protein
MDDRQPRGPAFRHRSRNPATHGPHHHNAPALGDRVTNKAPRRAPNKPSVRRHILLPAPWSWTRQTPPSPAHQRG